MHLAAQKVEPAQVVWKRSPAKLSLADWLEGDRGGGQGELHVKKALGNGAALEDTSPLSAMVANSGDGMCQQATAVLPRLNTPGSSALTSLADVKGRVLLSYNLELQRFRLATSNPAVLPFPSSN